MLKFLGKKIHQSWFIVMMAIGILIGFILAFLLRINFFMSPLWIVLVVILLVFGYLRPRFGFMVVALIIGMILAFFRVVNELYSEDYIRQFFGQTVLVSGVIEGDTETDNHGTKFKIGSLKFGEEKIEIEGSLYVSGSFNKDLARGDKICLEGKMEEGFGTYVGYMYKPRIVLWERPEPGDLVLKIRNYFAKRVSRLIPEPENKLGLSYLLGMKAGLPDELSEKLRIVGLVHIVVASGAHLSILVEIARKIFGRISRFSGFLFSVLFVVFFMSMVGWTPSIMRAGIMALMSLIAWYVGRKVEAWRMILIVAAFTLMLNPNFLFNLGWLLSFASYGGIMILGPKLVLFFYDKKKPGFIGSIVLTTVAATLMTLPIILYYYGTFSLISVLANLLILPTLPYAMGLVFLTGVFMDVPGVKMVISFLATKLLDFHIFVVDFFGGMKQFLVEIPSQQPQVFLIYVLIFGLLFFSFLKTKKFMVKSEYK